MVIVLKENPNPEQVKNLERWLAGMNITTRIIEGMSSTVMGLIGDTSRVEIELIRSLDVVESVQRIQEPYKRANRKFHKSDSVISVGDVKIGGGHFALIAGPCSVESREQIIGIAKDVAASGAQILRGGAFKPRTSPYAFQGLRGKGIELLVEAKKETGLKIITEIMEISQLPLFEEVDIIQVGARNMQNFELLKELGKCQKPILLKRGLSNTIQELLMSAEYIMSEGNENVILCERGIRTFETATRNTLDLSCVPVLNSQTHLPVIVDPSHGVGIADYVRPMSLAAVAAGADGLIIEVHNDPENALCDGLQSIKPDIFAELSAKINELILILRK
ncbi:MAG: 3-deoxy-7-phosphoheptulonate synthase [Oscillospiraceae bacterium]|nr:3-deoxy-7-phosphoheptulonate synthase [Oscillospiraceae bacterium]